MRYALILCIVVTALTLWGVEGRQPTAGLAMSSVGRVATPSWGLPPDPLTRTRRAGLVPETREFFAYHVHAHLDIFIDGRAVHIPGGIGINIHDPAVKHGNTATGMAYGGINQCSHPCISPLHTHDGTGVLHTESAKSRPNRLGQFFVEWGVRFSASCLDRFCRPRTRMTVYADGKRFTGNPVDIQLTDHKEIAIVVGSPPKHIPSSYGF